MIEFADVRKRKLRFTVESPHLLSLSLKSPPLQRPAVVLLQPQHVEHLIDLLSTPGTAGRLHLLRREHTAVWTVRVIWGQFESTTTSTPHVGIIAERRATMSSAMLRYRCLLSVEQAERLSGWLWSWRDGCEATGSGNRELAGLEHGTFVGQLQADEDEPDPSAQLDIAVGRADEYAGDSARVAG